jgi:hypothetical protein
MIEYIKEYCELTPVDEDPVFDADSGTWDLYFEEKKDSPCPYHLDRDLICIPFDRGLDAYETLTKLKQHIQDDIENKKQHEKQES